MIRILKGSALIGAVLRVIRCFTAAYGSSRLKRVVEVISLMLRQSVPGRLIRKYIYKSPFYEHSLIYKLVMAVTGVFDRLFAWINRVCVCLASGSVAVGVLKTAVGRGVASHCFTAGIFIMGMCIGTTLSMLITGIASVFWLCLTSGVFAVGCVMSLLSLFPQTVANCFVVRGIKWLINELN